ncbi:hypothetical protein AQ876_29465 [Burkholderia pseudomallei]|nr:hypothetical protein AQ875_03425 [Burkholderia pseudomallei]ONA13653.1 hypothetical protein AQ876_29465 [Burkholderia pseudomallei]
MKNLTSGGSSHGAPGRVDRIRVEICLGANERPTGAPRRTHPRGWATRAPADRARSRGAARAYRRRTQLARGGRDARHVAVAMRAGRRRGGSRRARVAHGRARCPRRAAAPIGEPHANGACAT